ncbi:DUF3035 domain-containing protein [Skermanella rosea]|uniref:DUF3035 domain-containing protein n=1 Tax=Skermanella rosea TaxID=1817965 RepID=UPI00193170B5|nr:DUF3035 domain-containing protein [Skermanella rosea]UEM04925.1 DUF3035 domain-containing protein [Skermanella rosea]
MDVISTSHPRHNPPDRGRPGRRPMAPLVCLALGALVLSGCSGARQTFGLDRTPPDEFSVVTRAPLAVPPEYRLRPPQPGAPRPQEAETRQQAASAVFGSAPETRQQAVANSPAATTGEAALLAQAGAVEVQPGIRSTVNRESVTLAAQDKRFIDSLLFWQTPDEPGTVVNAQQEQQRLRENAALGKPVTEGDTPIIERRRKAPLEGLFN